MIYLGSDHGGYAAKELIKAHLDAQGVAYEDLGTHSEESVDYPDYAFAVAEKVAADKDSRGILLCSTGIGMVMAANKVKGVLASLATDEYMGEQGTEHDEANVLALGGRMGEKLLPIVDAFLKAPQGGEDRHRRRVNKIREYENTHVK